MSTPARKSYPSEVTDAERESLGAVPDLFHENDPPRESQLRVLFNARH
jgi:hypothetical protein